MNIRQEYSLGFFGLIGSFGNETGAIWVGGTIIIQV